MFRVYPAIGVLVLLLLIAAAYVAFLKSRLGLFSLRDLVASLAALLLLGFGALGCAWATFTFAGGPDGRFLSREALSYGSLLIAAALLVVLFALRLIAVPIAWAALFLAPVVVAVAGQTLRLWPVTLAAFTAGPLLCLLVTVIVWVRREVASLAS